MISMTATYESGFESCGTTSSERRRRSNVQPTDRLA